MAPLQVHRGPLLGLDQADVGTLGSAASLVCCRRHGSRAMVRFIGIGCIWSGSGHPCECRGSCLSCCRCMVHGPWSGYLLLDLVDKEGDSNEVSFMPVLGGINRSGKHPWKLCGDACCCVVGLSALPTAWAQCRPMVGFDCRDGDNRNRSLGNHASHLIID
jgi:hypothetical protein